MARTKSSRGIKPFKLRSGRSPLPLFNPLQTLGVFDRLRDKIKGKDGDKDTLGKKLDSINEKLDTLTPGNIGSGGGRGSGDVILGGNKDVDPAELAANKAKKALGNSELSGGGGLAGVAGMVSGTTGDSGDDEEEILNKEV